jgi:signal transduction histidine kinase
LSSCLLIVEDNDDLRASLLALLQPRFEIALASTLSEALAVLERVVPDAVLSDIMLPDGDGYELLRRVRATDPLKRVPVLMVSARGEAAERARGLSAGADDYLAKPFDPEELTARIESAIERARTAAQSLQEHRQLISRELHDGPGGSLARSALLLEEALTTTAAERSRQLVGDALAAVREGIDELRLLLSMTKGQQHDWGTLTETIESDLAIGCAASALRLQFSASPAGDESGEFSVPTAVAHALRRIMREALTNVIKHAKATRVECVLRLDRAAGQIQLRFEDDGSGLTGQAGDGHGIGIMKQRAATCGGSLQIEKGVPSGTCVVATLNLDSGAERALSLAG